MLPPPGFDTASELTKRRSAKPSVLSLIVSGDLN